jgi:GMP synthase-like glutamine amidotransferase
LQHVPFEGLGSIAGWLAGRSASLTFTRFFDSERLPPLSDVNFIIALGGPMSVNEEERHPWLREEKRFVADAIAADKAVLGICLGSQLIASALGSRVYPGAEKEIGWFPVCAEPAVPEAFSFPASLEAFHWHGETFDLPCGAIHLAHSAACRHQAFQFGVRTIGLQFHLETTPESVDAIVANCGDELVLGRYTQTENALRNATAENYRTINVQMVRVLDYLVRNEREPNEQES